jgi:hypothetical protein
MDGNPRPTTGGNELMGTFAKIGIWAGAGVVSVVASTALYLGIRSNMRNTKLEEVLGKTQPQQARTDAHAS